jgi:regulator of PEP synthase PpsR (kinase-PPPase family)
MKSDSPDTLLIYLVSGSVGASGEQLVSTVLAQFPDARIDLKVIPHIRQPEQLREIIEQAEATGGVIIHTLVNTELRQKLLEITEERTIPNVDLMGDLINHLSDMLNQEPVGKPGLYRLLHKDYFERVAAIDFALAHDDGKNPRGWEEAEILLVGPSRTGKTPISMYLAVLGWKVANYPIVPEIPINSRLFNIDPSRVIGLTIDPTKLITHREVRQRRLGVSPQSSYTDPVKVFEEIKSANVLFKRGGFKVIEVTDKPIESCADEIIQVMIRRFGK